MSLLLALFLAAPVVHAQHPYAQFKALVAKAAQEVRLEVPLEVRQGIYPKPLPAVAWTRPSEPIIWVSPEHLDEPVGELCDTAYHEVIHQLLAQLGVEEGVGHEEHESWMAFFMVEDRCFGDDPEWDGVGYAEYLE